MADKKFADAALDRFNGKSDSDEPETAAEDAAPEDEKESDAVLGKMFAAALKRSDYSAMCVALRKICGDDY